MHQRTGGDPARVNGWCCESDHLTRAGEDVVVRMANDVLYVGGYADSRVAPTVLRIANPKKDRFVSIMVQDQRDFNVASIVDADGVYALVKEGQPAPAGAEPISVTDDFHLVVVRVEVRNEADLPAALAVYRTAAIEGAPGGPLPRSGLLARYRPEVQARALEMMQYWSKTAIGWLFGRPDERGLRVSDLDRATGIHYFEGGPLPEHSTYATFFTDASGETLRGGNGTYVLTTAPPPVDAFWSVTAYDTDRGGYFHPNPLNRYHVNTAPPLRTRTAPTRSRSSKTARTAKPIASPSRPAPSTSPLASTARVLKSCAATGTCPLPPSSDRRQAAHYCRQALAAPVSSVPRRLRHLPSSV